MAYWIFKLADQELYPDIPGEQYVYDNTHSVRIKAGDVFLYLDKRKNYSFSATGIINRVTQRKPSKKESSRTERIRAIFTAHLTDIIWFTEPLSISPLTTLGKKNRAKLGITDVNLLGWSQSIPRLYESMYESIMVLVQEQKLIPFFPNAGIDYSIEDAWGKTKVRNAVSRFADEVLNRHKNTCVVCGTKLKDVVEAAHLSPYATDKKNRSNPANGVCLCTFCHRALDRRLIGIHPNGELLVAESISDPVAYEHFTRIPASKRREWLQGVSPEFLALTVKWFHDIHPTKQKIHPLGRKHLNLTFK